MFPRGDWPLMASAVPLEVERRACARHAPHPSQRLVLIAALGEQAYAGKIHDVSTLGVALILNQCHGVGTHLTINGTGQFPRTLIMRVDRVVPRENGSYLHAGTLTYRLSESELSHLLIE